MEEEKVKKNKINGQREKKMRERDDDGGKNV
jgi:hypothetical protein